MSGVAAKICGLSTAEAVQSAAAAGARYVGFIFYEPSPRHVLPAQAAGLASAASAVEKVAVMVDPADDLIADVTAQVAVDLLQLHGSEDPRRVATIRQTFGVPVMKAVRVSAEEDQIKAREWEHAADMLLFDAKPPATMNDALPGGNALRFDWNLLRDQTWACPWMLSGGLTADNVAEAASVSGARIVDVSSGVESSPGQKDPALISRFLTAVARIES